MPIEADKSVVGIQPGNSLLRRFQTNLPDTGAEISRAANNLGNAVFNLGFNEFKAEGEKAAKDAALSAPIVKDANGQYVPQPPPEGFGYAVKKIYEDTYDARYIGLVQADQESRFNQIQADNIDSPENGRAKMIADLEGVKSKMDPRYAGMFETRSLQSINERTKSLSMSFAYRTEQQQVETTRKLVDNLEDEVTSLQMLPGTEAVVAQKLARRRELVDQLGDRAAGTSDPELKALEERSLLARGEVIKGVHEKINDGTITDDELAGVIRMLRDGVPADTSMLGFTPDWLAKNLPNAVQRRKLAAQLDAVREGRSAANAQTAAKVNVDNFNRAYDEGYKGKLVPDGQAVPVMVEYLKTLPGAPMPTSPEGAQALIKKYGYLPDDIAKTFFSNAEGVGAEQTAARYQLYKQLKEATPTGGGKPVDLTGAMDAKDAYFMTVYDGVMKSGGATSAVDAYEKTKLALAARVKVKPDEVKQQLFQDPEIKNQAGLNSFINKEMQSWWQSLPLSSHIPGVGYPDINKVPQAAREELEANIVLQRSYGATKEEAVKIAVSSFNKRWTQDPKVAGGWVSAERAVPQVLEIAGGKRVPTDRHLEPFVDKLLGIGADPGNAVDAATGQPGSTRMRVGEPLASMGPNRETGKPNPVPLDARLGENLVLTPNGNGTFGMVYKDASGGITVLQNAKTGGPLVVNLGALARDVGTRWNDRNRAHNDEVKRMETVGNGNLNAMPPGLDTSVPDLDPGKYVLKTSAGTDDLEWRQRRATSAGTGGRGRGLVPTEGDGSQRRPDVKVELPDGRVSPRADMKNLRPALVEYAGELVNEFSFIQVTSGARNTPGHPIPKASSQGSQHNHGNAFDFTTHGASTDEISAMLDKLTKDPRVGGIGYYGGGVWHVDFRAGERRPWGPNKSYTSLLSGDGKPKDWIAARLLQWKFARGGGQKQAGIPMEDGSDEA